MNMRYVRNRRRNGAFTLIELLVVILILAILAALIVPRVVGRTSDAKRAKAASDIATLSSLLQQYRIDNDKYPTSEDGLQSLRVQPSDAPAQSVGAALVQRDEAPGGLRELLARA